MEEWGESDGKGEKVMEEGGGRRESDGGGWGEEGK